MCGENLVGTLWALNRDGSSPRVRGKRTHACCLTARRGLIPACAGKTASWSSATSMTRAHPRVCGENPGWFETVARDAGSSPRVRGKLLIRSLDPGLYRLIPACAGKTSRRRLMRKPLRAHPRVCGENHRRPDAGNRLPGSSPRVRGKRVNAPQRSYAARLIPACAGKTPLR